MKKRAFLVSSAAMVATLLFSSGVKAANFAEFSVPAVQPSLVTPNDTFQIAILGYNTTETTAQYLVTPITATFNGLGTAQTFTGNALGGQVVTITTTQTLSGGNVTDAITLSVPTNFIPAGTTTASGLVVNGIELDMGFNSAGTNTLSFTPAITGAPTYAGSVLYVNGSLAVTPTPTLTNNGTTSTLYYYQAANTTATAGLSQFAIRQFNFSITYPVPEPSTYALCALGLAGFVGVVLRRRRAQA